MPLHRSSNCEENIKKSHLMQFEHNATLDRAPNVPHCRDHASLYFNFYNDY